MKAGVRSQKMRIKISLGWRIALFVGGPVIVIPALGAVIFARLRGVPWPNPKTGQVFEVCIGKFSCNPEYLTHRDFIIYKAAQAPLWGLLAASVAFVVFIVALGASKRHRAKGTGRV